MSQLLFQCTQDQAPHPKTDMPIGSPASHESPDLPRMGRRGGCEPWRDIPSSGPNYKQFTELFTQSGWPIIQDNEWFWPGLLNACSWGCSSCQLCTPQAACGSYCSSIPSQDCAPRAVGRKVGWQDAWLQFFLWTFMQIPMLDSAWAERLLGWEGVMGSRATAWWGEPLCVPHSTQSRCLHRCHTGLHFVMMPILRR